MMEDDGAAPHYGRSVRARIATNHTSEIEFKIEIKMRNTR
jgi:hypothetical protein